MPQKLDFLTPTSLRVLEHFFANPNPEFHEREVMRATGVSKGSANRILRELAELSLLERAERGRMVFYRLKADDPFVRQMKAAENVWELRDFVKGLKVSARKIILFGSCAEGTDAAESDIDVLILTEDKIAAKAAVSAFNRKAKRQMAPMILDVQEFAALGKEDKPLYERIDGGIVLWETA
jgi:predicted nucleotidyltransferase